MKMNRLKKFVALLTATAICALLPGVNAMTASADEPVTYYIKYVTDVQDWRYQTGGWNDSATHHNLMYLHDLIKDGDVIVVDNNGYAPHLNIEVGVKLSNLTVAQNSSAVVSTKGVDQCYVLSGSSAAVTGDVNDAYLYDFAAASFHGNVNDLTFIDTMAQSTGSATADGTVDHVIRKTDDGRVHFEMYNVAQGKLNISYATILTDATYYSTTPSTTPSAPATTQPAVSADEYDDVPKTGENNSIFLLLGTAVVCLLGKRALKRV
ncbi:MAG: hypothetical protein E7291_04990 [Lachnospiraceae bacterium]|nr:hypothetical protein [Lachnospiraceae bacterium]